MLAGEPAKADINTVIVNELLRANSVTGSPSNNKWQGQGHGRVPPSTQGLLSRKQSARSQRSRPQTAVSNFTTGSQKTYGERSELGAEMPFRCAIITKFF